MAINFAAVSRFKLQRYIIWNRVFRSNICTRHTYTCTFIYTYVYILKTFSIVSRSRGASDREKESTNALEIMFHAEQLPSKQKIVYLFVLSPLQLRLMLWTTAKQWDDWTITNYVLLTVYLLTEGVAVTNRFIVIQTDLHVISYRLIVFLGSFKIKHFSELLLIIK